MHHTREIGAFILVWWSAFVFMASNDNIKGSKIAFALNAIIPAMGAFLLAL